MSIAEKQRLGNGIQGASRLRFDNYEVDFMSSDFVFDSVSVTKHATSP